MKVRVLISVMVMFAVVFAHAAEDKIETTPILRLWFDASKVKGRGVPDFSGCKNKGTIRNRVEVVEGRSGRKAFSFKDLKSFVNVPNSDSLDPSRKAISVEVVAKVGSSSGVMLARGGNVNGYCLAVRDGRPLFAVAIGSKTVEAVCPKGVDGWYTITGVITADQKIELFMNGKCVARKKLEGLIKEAPTECMQVGVDQKGCVIVPKLNFFQGLIESVKVYEGEKK